MSWVKGNFFFKFRDFSDSFLECNFFLKGYINIRSLLITLVSHRDFTKKKLKKLLFALLYVSSSVSVAGDPERPGSTTTQFLKRKIMITRDVYKQPPYVSISKFV